MCENKQLTPKQKEAIECMVEHKDWPLIKVAEKIGLHYNSIYKWNKQDLFREELDRELHRCFKDAARQALKKMIDLMNCGNAIVEKQAADFILSNTSYKQADKVEITSSGFEINITNNELEED